MSASTHRHTIGPGLEHDFEVAHGLPEALPPNEKILWQGAPQWRTVARESLHVRILSIYFGLLLVGRGVTVLSDKGTLLDAAIAVLWLLPFALLAVGMLTLLAWLISRTTVYTITDKRVVMRIGVVLSITFNLPFRLIGSAGLRAYADGSGNIPIALTGSDRIAIVHLWPHSRPWRIAKPEPMLIGLADAAHVGVILSQALAKFETSYEIHHAAETQSSASVTSIAPPTRDAAPQREKQRLVAAG